MSCTQPHTLPPRFLQLFQANKDKGKDSLKFAINFGMEVSHSDESTIGKKTDYYPIGFILREHGMQISDYKNSGEALEAARHLVKKNAEHFGWDPKKYPEKVDEKHPEFSTMWFVWSLGKTETYHSVQKKTLSQDAPLDSMAKLEQGKVFMEGIGWQDPDAESGSSSVTIEAAKYQELQAKVELLKTTYLDFKHPTSRDIPRPDRKEGSLD